MNLLFRRIIIAASAISCVGIASANSTLTLNDGNGHVQTVTGTGFLTFIGSVGDWAINVTTGLGFPDVGTPTSPVIDLNSINVYKGSGGAGNTLKMTFSEDVFGPLSGSFLTSVGGTLAPGSSFMVDSKLNGNLLTTQSFPGSGAFSGSMLTGGSGGFPSTLTLEAAITATLGGRYGASSSFDAELRAVPDSGTTFALLGCALIGLGGLRSRWIRSTN